MKVTVITNEKGELVGTIQGEYGLTEIEGRTALAVNDEADSSVQAGILLEPGQQTQEIEVPDEVAQMDADDFLERIRSQLGG
jgi:hypothetical protein